MLCGKGHGRRDGINFNIEFPINVCGNSDCNMEFILLYHRENGDTWEQVANKGSKMYCPYCGEEFFKGE